MRNSTCGLGCTHFIPVIVIVIAVLFLLQALNMVSNSVVSVVWPILLGLIGIAKLEELR